MCLCKCACMLWVLLSVVFVVMLALVFISHTWRGWSKEKCSPLKGMDDFLEIVYLPDCHTVGLSIRWCPYQHNSKIWCFPHTQSDQPPQSIPMKTVEGLMYVCDGGAVFVWIELTPI